MFITLLSVTLGMIVVATAFVIVRAYTSDKTFLLIWAALFLVSVAAGTLYILNG